MRRINYLSILSALIALTLATTVSASETTKPDILKILKTDLEKKGSLNTAGVIVHLGCGDGSVTALMGAKGRRVVHGLDASATQVAKARAHIQSLGLYGRIAIDRLTGPTLPYADNIVNVVVADELGAVPMAEVMRVLAPNGIAYIKTKSLWKKTTKPRPGDIDDWTHYLHGPDNNAVAQDTVIAPPRRLQWQSGPKWTRHHDKMSSLSAMVSSGGRIFYIIDEGSSASIFMPSHWALVARDAFNGKLLWKREIDNWYSRYKGLKDGPADAPRRLIAVDGRIYATLDLHGGVVCLDATSGETIREYEGTDGAEEILLSDGKLHVLIGPGSIGDGRRQTRPVEKRIVMTLDAQSGKKLWQHSDIVAALTMAVDAQRLYYFNFESQKAVCLDRKSGQRLWTSADTLPTPKSQFSYFASKLVVSDGVMLFASGEFSGIVKSGGGANKSDTLTAISSETGKTIWTAKHPPSGYSSPEDLFVIDGIVWFGNVSGGGLDGTHIGIDLKTGEEKHRFAPDKKSYWFHHRCYPGRATSNFIMTSRTGIEFIDIKEEKWDLNHWIRGACVYGIMPANGLIYAPPAPCICYSETYLHSFNALAPAATSPLPILPDSARLQKGPAYAKVIRGKAAPSDWPTYRGSNSRAGAASAAIPATLDTAWTVDIGGKLSAPTIADGKVFLAQVDRHTIHAFEVDSGEAIWSYTTGGRVDSPPTYFEGRVIFGSNDGSVYCLRADDAELIWRFTAATTDRRTLVYEQIESLWPVHGSVLVQNGIAHFVAGRSSFVDGGMWLYRLNAKSGEIVSKTQINERNPKTGENVHDTVNWLNMAVGRPDILSSDGQRLYMRSQAFDLAGKRLDIGPQMDRYEQGKDHAGPETHLFCPTGFLDDTYFHRSYWMYGKTFASGWSGYYVAGKYAPAGKIMAVGKDRLYAFGREPEYYKWTIPMEYRLFASNKSYAPGPKRKTATPPPTKNAKNKKKNSGKDSTPAPITNKANYAWTTKAPILARAMTLAGDTLFIAGPRDVLDESALGRSFTGEDTPEIFAQEAAFAGKSGGLLWAVSTTDGAKRSELKLDAPPVFDGLAAAGSSLYLTTVDGKLLRLSGKR